MSDTELAHFGVKGMRWGKHTASTATGSGTKPTHSEKSDARLSKHGEVGANVRIVGKTLGTNMLLNVGTKVAMTAVRNSPKAKVGIAAVSAILGTANAVKGIRDVVGVEKAVKRSNAANGQPMNQYVGATKKAAINA